MPITHVRERKPGGGRSDALSRALRAAGSWCLWGAKGPATHSFLRVTYPALFPLVQWKSQYIVYGQNKSSLPRINFLNINFNFYFTPVQHVGF